MKHEAYYKKKKRGQAMIITVVFFLFILTTIIVGVSFAVLRQVKSGQNLIRSKESYHIAEAGLENILYKIENSIDYSDIDIFMINGYFGTTTVSDISGGKLVVSEADRDGSIVKVSASIYGKTKDKDKNKNKNKDWSIQNWNEIE
ncbi:MAG: pilus assembly PilX N-terminal domain-containing protein [Patescibacteria group bacterium]|nr:pilus assembly PilX N-terminal domain-containing protein [Patescibacteria group bacterium]